MTPAIDILLATRNGAPHLPEQLDSLLSQSDGDWRLLVRDDSSTDETPGILRRYRERHPGRIIIVDDDGRRLGACGNFGLLLEQSSAPYVMFCDQDDVWIPEKVELTRQEMGRLESAHGTSTPLLVHTDLMVVDESLRPMFPSLWKMHHADPCAGKSFNRLLVQNVVTGCTVMINRSLVMKSLPIPPDSVMHDWWITLVAAAFGVIGEVQEKTVLYRQHLENDTGARRSTPAHLISRIFVPGELRREFHRIQRQAGAFLDRYRPQLSASQRELLEIFSGLDSYGPFVRRWYLLKYGLFHSGISRNIGRLLMG